MEYQSFIEFISNLGFPIFITLYLLVRFEKKLNELTKAITDLVSKL